MSWAGQTAPVTSGDRWGHEPTPQGNRGEGRGICAQGRSRLRIAVKQGCQQRAPGRKAVARAQRAQAFPPQAFAAPCGPDGSAEGAAELRSWVHPKRHHHPRGQHHREMLRAMTILVRKGIPWIVQRLDRLIVQLPPRSSPPQEAMDVTLAHAQVRHPTDVVDLVLAQLPLRTKSDPYVGVRGRARHVMDTAKPMHETRGTVVPLLKGHAPSGRRGLHLIDQIGLIAFLPPKNIVKMVSLQGLEGRSLCTQALCGEDQREGGGSWRNVARHRWAAWRSPSFWAMPSGLIMGSGIHGSPAWTSGWIIAAPHIW
jgi:hypothetical protein